ncbi:hypothetical protein QZH41_013520, partial [Actinostola sp. cb2023]
MTNLTKLGRSGKKTDEPIMPLKNNMVALRRGVFNVTRKLIGIEKLDPATPGYRVNLRCIVQWIAREMRLHGQIPKELVLNLKVDGRPFFGKSQVSVGVVPVDFHRSTQSAKSVYTLAIANCDEERKDLKILFSSLNAEKDTLKRDGIIVDGIKYDVSFKITLDYKGLTLLLAKAEDDKFQLGGRGLNVEFCIFCEAVRACDCDLGIHELCLEHFVNTKANIGGFKGIRDDLTCILDEDISSMCLCALHCEMRNTEQILKSVGLMAYKIGSLDECNNKLKEYGPENVRGDRIKTKLKSGQTTAVERNNMSISSFSGSTERQMLEDIKDIVKESLPQEKLVAHFKPIDAAKNCILNKLIFCKVRQKYYSEMLDSKVFVRDFGTKLEEIPLSGSVVADEINELQKSWESKGLEIEAKFKEVYGPVAVKRRRRGMKAAVENEELSLFAAEITKEFMTKVCTSWKEIAEIMRKKEYAPEEEHFIDSFDLKCKEWGFLLCEMFGKGLGTGDYGHLTVEHAPMLMRVHRSFRRFSNQGFEASHKLQRQLYLKATSHDSKGYTTSLDQILTHLYTETLLELRLSFREALHCASEDDQLPLLDYSHSDWDKILDVPQHLNDKESKFNCTIDEENEVTP